MKASMAKGRTGDRAGINPPARSAFQRRNREQFLFFFVGRSTSGMLFRAAQKVQVSKNHRWRNLKRTAPRGHCRERATHQSNYDNSECKIREHPFVTMLPDLPYGLLLREAHHDRNEDGVHGKVERTRKEYERHHVLGVKRTYNEIRGSESEAAAQDERCRAEQQ